MERDAAEYRIAPSRLFSFSRVIKNPCEGLSWQAVGAGAHSSEEGGHIKAHSGKQCQDFGGFFFFALIGTEPSVFQKLF